MTTQFSVFSLLSFKIWLVQLAAYHGFGLWFEWLDRSGSAARFRVRPPERQSYFEFLPRVLINQTFALLPAMVGMEALGLAYVGPAHLSAAAVIFGFAGLMVGHDVVQYVAHRLILHEPASLRLFGHQIHHTTRASRAISACYMSAPDFFLEIVCPYLIPLALIGGGGSNVMFHSVVVAAGAFGGLYEHSGYDFSIDLQKKGGWRERIGKLLSSEAHGAHHRYGNVSFSDGFGSSNICDTLFGTRWDLAAKVRERRAPRGPAWREAGDP